MESWKNYQWNDDNLVVKKHSCELWLGDHKTTLNYPSLELRFFETLRTSERNAKVACLSDFFMFITQQNKLLKGYISFFYAFEYTQWESYVEERSVVRWKIWWEVGGMVGSGKWKKWWEMRKMEEVGRDKKRNGRDGGKWERYGKRWSEHWSWIRNRCDWFCALQTKRVLHHLFFSKLLMQKSPIF